MKTIWAFGCSFTARYAVIDLENTYPNLIAKNLNYKVNNLSSVGNCNDKIFFDLLENIDKINNNDIILYQFTSFNRIGFFNPTLDNSYICSNGLVEFGIKNKKNSHQFKNVKIEDLDILLSFILKWQPKRMKFLLEKPLNLLRELKKSKNVDYHILFMNDDINKNPDYVVNQNEIENIVTLPTKENDKNISMSDLILYKNLYLGYEFSDILPNDIHPGFSGHKKIAKIIENKIKL